MLRFLAACYPSSGRGESAGVQATPMRIVIGCDDNGCKTKEIVAQLVAGRGHEVQDMGGPRPYYEVALEAARKVSTGQADRAILVCGSGMGMAIIANKVRGVYAAVCETPAAARGSRSINNSNVLTLGEKVTSADSAREIVEAWLDTSFTQGFDSDLQQWLKNSLKEIDELERRQFA